MVQLRKVEGYCTVAVFFGCGCFRVAAEIPNLDETHLLQVNPPGKTVYRCILFHVFFAKPNRFQLQPQALELCPIELDIYVISK